MDPIKNFIHQLNADAHRLNKNIMGNSNGVPAVPLNKEIYQPTQKQEVQPKPKESWFPSESYGLNHTQPAQQPVVQPIPRPTAPAIDEKTTKEFIDRLTSVEKKIDRFFNLIEKRVVKNAKEVTIRIKLNEEKIDENSNTEQE